MTERVALPSRRQFVLGAMFASAVAAAALVLFVLPAERGIDPTGFGAATGLTGLSQTGPAANIYLQRGQARRGVLFPLSPASTPDEATLRATLSANGLPAPAGPLRNDSWTYELLPYENIEMKYRLAQGQPLIFAWHAAKPLHFDMHSVPDRGGNPATESFVISDAPGQSALYLAPFTGIHGWFWQNQSLEPVTVTIAATGGFSGAVIFNQAGEHPRTLAPPTDGAAVPD